MRRTIAGATTVASEEPEFELGELFEEGELGDPEKENGEFEMDPEAEAGEREKETGVGEKGVMREVWRVVGICDVLKEVGMRDVLKEVGMREEATREEGNEMPPILKAEAQATTARRRTRVEIFCILFWMRNESEVEG